MNQLAAKLSVISTARAPSMRQKAVSSGSSAPLSLAMLTMNTMNAAMIEISSPMVSGRLALRISTGSGGVNSNSSSAGGSKRLERTGPVVRRMFGCHSPDAACCASRWRAWARVAPTPPRAARARSTWSMVAGGFVSGGACWGMLGAACCVVGSTIAGLLPAGRLHDAAEEVEEAGLALQRRRLLVPDARRQAAEGVSGGAVGIGQRHRHLAADGLHQIGVVGQRAVRSDRSEER